MRMASPMLTIPSCSPFWPTSLISGAVISAFRRCGFSVAMFDVL
jgi:hypothetical protein